MRLSLDRTVLLKLIAGHPDVGALMSLCEENFTLMQRLAPGLAAYPAGPRVSRRPEAVDLHLDVEECARYTTLVRLTHRFAADDTPTLRTDPDARLRVYHDARQVEVLALRQSILPLRTPYAPPALADKWRINLFLSKWLQFCLRQGHGFASGPEQTGNAPGSKERAASLSRSVVVAPPTGS